MTQRTIRKPVMRAGSFLTIVCLCVQLGSAFGFDAMLQSDLNPLIVTSRVKEVMHRFAVAVKKKDMESFHGSVVMSATLAEQYPVEKMNAAFKPLMDSGVDLAKLDAMQPIFDAPMDVDAVNQLIIKGHYASSPPTVFEMKFIHEGSRLGLSFIDVHIAEDTPAPARKKNAAPPTLTKQEGLPDAATLSALGSHAKAQPGVQLPSEQMTAVRAAMHAFAVGVKKKNMGEFLQADIVSQSWRQQQTAAQVDASYRNTIATGGDFILLDGLVPVIPETPAQDEYGVLTISGYYDDPTARIGFKMGFVNEAGSLRLVNFAIIPGHANRKSGK